MKRYWLLAIVGIVCLSFAAVWMGGLNQDEGWYLYAANMVAEGKTPYRDFFYTQGPLMPIVYSAFTAVWSAGGLLGARLLTLALGIAGVLFAAALARRLADGEEAKRAATPLVLLLLGSNLYHLYYLAIPKTYALASLFVIIGFYLLSFLDKESRGIPGALFGLGAGLCLAFAAGTRISLGAILCVVGLSLLLARRGRALLAFSIGGFAGLGLVYGPFLADNGARAGLLAAQAYHAARGGFDPVWTVGSFSRLVRWYLPVFVLFGLWLFSGRFVVRGLLRTLLLSFLAVFSVQMLAPFPYEDYQVPLMGILTVCVVVGSLGTERFAARPAFACLLALGLTWAGSFGSPLLEKWSTNGQDRFWSIKKPTTELAQLREVARRIEAADPGGKEILTQDLYLAIETRRRVPEGLEMGPFSFWGDACPLRGDRRLAFDDASLRTFLASAPCAIAALSGYSFAITAPACSETPIERQLDYWEVLKRNYTMIDHEEAFGQNATTLVILKRK